MQRILIAGCGDVGCALGALLAADGAQVFGLRRDPSRLPDSIAPVAGDLGQPGTLGALPREVDVLAYAAAADGFDDEAYRRAYVDGVRNVLGVLDRSRLARVVLVSSTGVYAQDDGGWVDEQSATEPAGFSGRRLLEGEAIVAGCGVSGVSVRFGGIYGPGRHRLIEQVRAGTRCSDAPVVWTNRIHRDDCAGVLRHLIRLPDPRPVYIGVDCEPAPQCDVMDWLAARMGVAPPARTGMTPAAHDAGSPRRRGGNKRCSNRRLLDSGYRFTYPTFRDGYARELRSAGLDRGEG